MTPPITSFVIYGEMAQKGNSRRIVQNPMSLKLMLVKSPKALNWAHNATVQLRSTDLLSLTRGVALFTERVKMTVRAYYADESSDLDCSVLEDVLQSRYSGKGKARRMVLAGVVENDRLIRHKEYLHFIDPTQPRAEVTIEVIE